MNHGNQITWQRGSRYSPVQDRSGVKVPTGADFPPATERVSQHVDPYQPGFLDEREVLRVTYQGDDRCQLACPGCYTGARLRQPLPQVQAAGGRKVAPWEDFTGHIEALGDGLQDFFLLGAEATVDPAGSAAKLAYAHRRGLPQQIITHGAVSVDRFERTFGAAIDSGGVHKLIISLDSTRPEINNGLRGRPYAHQRTMELIRHCVGRGVPFKVQMTVWPANYTTILESVRRLFDLGVRGFSFHCGSLEGMDDPAAVGMDHVDPLAWRALVEQILRFRDSHRDVLWTFNVPFVFVTEAELERYVIGDAELTRAFLAHLDAVEQGRVSTKPVNPCPAVDIPQVYVYGNDGPEGRGTVSLCNVDADPTADAYADYDPQVRRWRVRTDPARNQLQHMVDSPHLCPATPYALRQATGRFTTEAGDLFHVCRYIGCGQMPADLAQFGNATYLDACAFYTQVARALAGYSGVGQPPMARVRRLTNGVVPLWQRALIIAADLDAPAEHHDGGPSTPPEPSTGPGAAGMVSASTVRPTFRA